MRRRERGCLLISNSTVKADRPQPATVRHLAQAKEGRAPDKAALLLAYSAGSITSAATASPRCDRKNGAIFSIAKCTGSGLS